MKKISIVVPCYNEEGNLLALYKRIKAALLRVPLYDYEIIFADNASTDNSEDILRESLGDGILEVFDE